jgi:DNA-binding Xre family transcriptional regulator
MFLSMRVTPFGSCRRMFQHRGGSSCVNTLIILYMRTKRNTIRANSLKSVCVLIYNEVMEGEAQERQRRPLRACRKSAYLSVRDLAKLAQVNPATIWRLESGRTKEVHPSTARRIAQVLGVQPGEVAEFAIKQ